ncbi:hypothetical protein ID47_03865 [Candidatus Paracaedibacter acanthamoebae]|uniref:Uncharacterized protein n=1 Tax=Candidatus Odyssella acanthamoebae TaxID=91604 RepID=A0A077AWQ0_9PROT|nr:hypothetical protein ID47_03865 [Candidatus Paracaedibacter acanthamoebae]
MKNKRGTQTIQRRGEFFRNLKELFFSQKIVSKDYPTLVILGDGLSLFYGLYYLAEPSGEVI